MSKPKGQAGENRNNPVRLGIIGSGLAVKYLHWPALTALPGCFKVVATCDIVPEARAEIAEMAAKLNQEQYGEAGEVAQDSDYRALLARPEVEAVLISLPIHLNAEVMTASALAGKHILCEKPIASNLNQARKLVTTLNDIGASRGLTIEIAENYHYRQELNEAKKWAFEEKLIGDVAVIQAHGLFFIDITQGFASTPWRMDNQYRGGIVSDGGVHYAALLRRLGGEIEQIQAFSKQLHPNMASVDTLSLNVRFRNGVIGHLLYSGAISVPSKELVECYIFGTGGTIKIGRNIAHLYHRSEGDNPYYGEVKEQKVFEAEKSGYYLEFLDFYEGIRQGKPVLATPEECLRDFEIIMKAFDSAEECNTIFF